MGRLLTLVWDDSSVRSSTNKAVVPKNLAPLQIFVLYDTHQNKTKNKKAVRRTGGAFSPRRKKRPETETSKENTLMINFLRGSIAEISNSGARFPTSQLPEAVFQDRPDMSHPIKLRSSHLSKVPKLGGSYAPGFDLS
jgi:hypothetical protein